MPGACYRPFAGVLLALGLAGLLPAQAMAETTTPDAPSPEVQAVQAQRQARRAQIQAERQALQAQRAKLG